LLIGDLHRGTDKRFLVLCHGMESTRGGTKQQAMVERFVPAGFSVLRFDFSYVGDSEGSFEDLTLTGEVADALGALDFLAEFEPELCVLIGSSLGGAVALLTAAQAADAVDAVATIAAVADCRLFTERLSEADLAKWRSSGRRTWGEGYLKADFLDDVERLDIPAAIAALTQPVLVMHGEADDVVPSAHARIIERNVPGPVRVKMFPGVGHRFEEPGALDGLLETLESWLADVAGGSGARG
jgi:putative redox protein